MTAQTFRETARRRALEAKHLLSFGLPTRPQRTTFDAAVTCALLAAECALKALLLHGHACDAISDYEDEKTNPCFSGRSGHSLGLLLDRQAPEVTRVLVVPIAAIGKLANCNRYQYRYGNRRPTEEDAAPFVEAAELIVAWMSKVFE